MNINYSLSTEYLRSLFNKREEMMILPFLLILLQCSVETVSTEINKDETSLSTECLATQEKTIIIHLDFQKDLPHTEKVLFVANTLQYLVEMLLKRSTCFKLFVFSLRRGALVELTENVVIESFLDNEFPRSFNHDEFFEFDWSIDNHYHRDDDFSILFDQLPNTGNKKHVLLYVDARFEEDNRDDSLITTQLRLIQQVKSYEVIFLCLRKGNLCPLTEQWILPNRLIMNNVEHNGWNYFDNMNKELLDVLKNPNFNHLQMYEILNLQNSSFGKCKTRMFFWMNFWIHNNDVCSQKQSRLHSRLMFFFYQRFSSPIKIFEIRYDEDGVYDTERLNTRKGYLFGRGYLADPENSTYAFADKPNPEFNIKPFCTIHIDIRWKTCYYYQLPDARFFKSSDLRVKVLIDDENENDRSFVKREDGTIVIWERDLDSVEFKTMLIEKIRNTKCANGCRFI